LILTTDRHEVSHGLSRTAELLVLIVSRLDRGRHTHTISDGDVRSKSGREC